MYEMMNIGSTNKVKATFKRDDEEIGIETNVWIDFEGKLRIAVPVENPQHAGDIGQLIFDVEDFQKGFAKSITEKLTQDPALTEAFKS